ncbi:lipid-A-disaccharide synthase [Acidobacteria bacterium AH-259-O06]|nr:lipid-A-disaccharide synthase [Acidobacteria bacterium AH-259-O06]
MVEPLAGDLMVSRTSSILVVTGETSGENHAAGLIKQMELQNPDWHLQWFGSGGSQMEAAGTEVLFDISQLAAIGPWEALAHLGHYWRLYRRIVAETRKRRPCLAVLVDFPEFNLSLASRLKALKVPICYFIGPQVWAWRPSRVKQIKRYVDLMLVIFPFEEQFYRRQGIEAHYVGNPCIALREFLIESENGSDGREASSEVPVVALLPGSRKREVEQIFPVQLDAARCVAERHPVKFWVVKAAQITRTHLSSVYENWLHRGNPALQLEIHEEPVPRLLPQVSCAIVKSGTSTLEATILQVPFAMVYRLSRTSWYLVRPLVNTNTYCLANLIAGRQIVPEFVQDEATGDKIGAYVLGLLKDQKLREEVRKNLEMTSKKLGERNAYQEGAKYISQFLKKDDFF